MGNQGHILESNTLLNTQFDILFANSRWLIIGQLLLATTILAWLWGQAEPYIILTWYAFAILPPIYRARLTYRYHQINQHDIGYWKSRYLAGSFIYGIIWASPIFIDLPPTSFYFILFVLSGYLVVTVSSSSTYLPAVTYFVSPVGVLVSLRCLMLEFTEPGQGWLFAFLIVFFATIVILLSARVLNRSILTGLQLRFENIELVKTLKAQKAELEAAKEMSEKANSDKSRFLAAASHDLRQPLHAMSLFLDAIRHCDDKKERMALHENLEKSVVSLGELFNALLDISKIDAGVIDIQRTGFYLSDIVSKVVNEFDLAAKNKGIKLSFRPSSFIVDSDPLWLERIIRNLVSNAIRYTDKGRVLITCRRRNGACLVQIWDSGQGIAIEKQSIIFQEFTQLHNPQRDRNNGLGLGLAIVKRLCHLLQHTINVQSILGKGSVFSLTVPLSAQVLIKKNSSAAEYTINQLIGKTMLVIDDELEVRSAMTAVLENWGCKVITADSLASAYELLDQQSNLPAVIISDYRLANNCTGLQALSALRQRYNVHIPAVLVTGETDAKTIRTINDSGHKVLHKPVKPAKLRLVINSLVIPSKKVN